MREVFVEFTGAGVVVYRPGTFTTVATVPSLGDALAFARAEWPDLGIRVVVSKGARAFCNDFPRKCAHCGV